MSLPTFPVIDPPLKIEDSISMILASIAMEESALSHIINAEGEKLQYVLGTLDKKPDKKASVEELLAVNKSIKNLIDSITQNQLILKGKMQCAIDALEGYCIIGPPGPQGPTGPTGPAGCHPGADKPCGHCGPQGPKGADGYSGAYCAVSFLGCPEQCWDAEKPLLWLHSECSSCCSLCLSPDQTKIILERYGCYVVSFSLDLCAAEHRCNYVAVSLQTTDCHKKSDRFICHIPVIYDDAPFTASASGIFIPTQNCSEELMLTLLSPASVTVKQSSICIMEI